MSGVSKTGVGDSGTTPTTITRFRLVAWLLRAEGVVDLAAAIFIFLPVEGIQSANQLLDLDPIPSHPLTWYFIRSTSAIYAACGALLLFLSLDVPRYRPVIRFLGGWAVFHGALMVVVDRSVGMPNWWCMLEGSMLAAVGVFFVWLCRPAGAA